MKLGQFPDSGTTAVSTNEGVFDFLKIFNNRKRLTDEEISTMVGNINNKAIEQYLNKTLLDKAWVDKNLSNKTGTPVKSVVAFINGKNVSDPKKLVNVLKEMQSSAEGVLRILKGNTELRQRLCKELKGKRGRAANEAAEALYEQHRNELPIVIEKLWQEKGGRNIREAVGYDGRGDGWPCSVNNRNQPEFKSYYSFDHPRGCSIDEVTQSTAFDYGHAILDIVKIIQNSAYLINKNRIPYWEDLDLDYDTLDNADEIYDGLATGQHHLAINPITAVMWTAKTLLKELLKAI